ncbi:MAG: gliding motility-associated C-terminal domain-containing protein [Flavipsychrobacter sp.]
MLKKPLSLLLLLFITSMACGQNLVPNGNFEYYTRCPAHFSQIADVPAWRQYHKGTADFYHECGIWPVSAPYSVHGYQMPASGKGYSGIISFTNVGGVLDTFSYTEYITTPITPMVKGNFYKVSMSVSLANISKWASDGLGVFFYDVGPSATVAGSAAFLQNKPQVYFDTYGPIADTQNWVRLSSIVYADSAYDNIVIGTFIPQGGLKVQYVSIAGSPMSYYFIDSVVVAEFKEPTLELSGKDSYCEGELFNLNYTTNEPYSLGNIFTVELSDYNGSFANNTKIIGSKLATTSGSIKCTIPTSIIPSTNYRLRLLSSSPSYKTPHNNKKISIGIYPQGLKATVNSPLCSGEVIKMNVNSNTQDVIYTWTGPVNFIGYGSYVSIANAQTVNAGKYTATASVLGCEASKVLDVLVNSYPEINVSKDSFVCIDDSLALIATTNISSATSEWKGPANFIASGLVAIIPNVTKKDAGRYIVTVDNFGCKTSKKVNMSVIDLNIDIGNDIVLCNGEEKILNAEVPSQVDPFYRWQDGSSNSEYLVMHSGMFHVSISTMCGFYSDTINIDYQVCKCTPFIPTAFTPNNDGRNDKIGVTYIDCDVSQYKFLIVNRFGEVVFESTDVKQKWDGVYKGVEAELGTYYYLLQLTGPFEKKYLFKGDIVLIR